MTRMMSQRPTVTYSASKLGSSPVISTYDRLDEIVVDIMEDDGMGFD